MTDSKPAASPHWRGSRISPTAIIGPYCVIHESVVGDRAIVKERVSLKRCEVGEGAELNAGSFWKK